MTNVPYSNVRELRAVDTVEQANALLKTGWAFLKHYQEWTLKNYPTGTGQETQDRFLLGRAGLTAPIGTQPASAGDNRFQSTISSQNWRDGKNGGQWCWALESNGQRRPEVLDLITAIEKAQGGLLAFEGFEYTLSPKQTKKFIRRRRLQEG